MDHPASPSPRLPVWVFGISIFVSAFLLFQIQPMIGKVILPWFGGGSAVWTVSMLFFQTLLLGGYAYAHILSRLDSRSQARLHLLILAAAFVWMILMASLRTTPILPDSSLKPTSSAFPVWQVLWVLTASVGIPYFLLTTNSSLAQAWFSKVQQRSSPYAFYALSNAASLIALLSYPVLFEPAWTLQQQTSFWSIGFIVYLGLAAFCAALLLRSARAARDLPNARASLAGIQDDRQPTSTHPDSPPKPTLSNYLIWIVLAAIPSIMLLAVTNQITQDVASVPFLWILPLSIYLLSFILAFSDRLKGLRNAYPLAALISCGFGYITLEMPSQLSIIQLIAANAALLFAISLFCHSTLYAQRPHPRYLTSFYLMLSVGGVLGGVLVSLVAPAIFPDFWEYPLGLLLSAALAVIAGFRSRSRWFHPLRFPMAFTFLALALFTFLTVWQWVNSSVYMSRSFYGVLRVRKMTHESILVYNLVHGRIIHGSQALGKTYGSRPTRYYSPSTGVGLAFTDNIRRAEGRPMRIGIVGLGAGTVAAYGQPGDVIRFYEINPQVVEIAKDKRFFTYLANSAADIEIILGDARLSMERELREGSSQAYDLLAIDAFSGDSIPTHLINREAVAVYLKHLADDGILAFHISNRHLDLEPVAARLAAEFNLNGITIVGGSQDWLGTNSTWVLLSRSPVALGMPRIAAAKQTMKQRPDLRLWTDDYSNLLQVLR